MPANDIGILDITILLHVALVKLAGNVRIVEKHLTDQRPDLDVGVLMLPRHGRPTAEAP